jgi:copper chaperone CopZ
MITTLFTLALSTQLYASNNQTTLSKVTQTSETMTLNIKGMVCSSCEEKITKSLMQIPGVLNVTADHAAGTAILTLKPKAKVSLETIKKAVKKAGFEVQG